MQQPKMIKVRMKVSIASATWNYQPGQVVLLDADLARKWLAVGHAEPVDKDTPVTEAAALVTNDYRAHDPYVAFREAGIEVR